MKVYTLATMVRYDGIDVSLYLTHEDALAALRGEIGTLFKASPGTLPEPTEGEQAFRDWLMAEAVTDYDFAITEHHVPII